MNELGNWDTVQATAALISEQLVEHYSGSHLGLTLIVDDDILTMRETDPRAYAFVLQSEAPRGWVHVAPDFDELPPANVAGILWHEVGHLLAIDYGDDMAESLLPEDLDPLVSEASAVYPADRVHDEVTANAIVLLLFGVRIEYAGDPPLQLVAPPGLPPSTGSEGYGQPGDPGFWWG